MEDPSPAAAIMGNGWAMETNRSPFMNQIRQAIDAALEQSPSTFEDFLKILEASGVEVTAAREICELPCSRPKEAYSLQYSERRYTEQAIRERIAGTYIPSVQPKRSHSSVRMLIDIDAACVPAKASVMSVGQSIQCEAACESCGLPERARGYEL